MLSGLFLRSRVWGKAARCDLPDTIFIVDRRVQHFGMGHKKGRRIPKVETLQSVRKKLTELERPKADDPVETFDGIVRSESEFGPIEVASQQTIKKDRWSMTPHQYWITHGKGCERPFTGDFWYHKDVGHYECAICNNLLFEYPTTVRRRWHK